MSSVKKRIGINVSQSIIKKATQSNLSMFHNAGNFGNDDEFISLKPSVAHILSLENNMSCSAEAICNEYIYKKEFCKLYMRDILVEMIHSKYIEKESHENCFYMFIDEEFGKCMRFYFDIRKIYEYGYTLKDISNIIFDDRNVILSPDFMGIIDFYNTNNADIYVYYDPSYLINDVKNSTVNGIKNMYLISYNDTMKIHTVGSNIMEMLLNNKIESSTIISNNILDVEKRFGIEAANQLIKDLLEKEDGYILADFMTRTGDAIKFGTESLIKNDRGFITTLSFQNPRQAISKFFTKNTEPVQEKYLSIFSSIFEGLNFYDENQKQDNSIFLDNYLDSDEDLSSKSSYLNFEEEVSDREKSSVKFQIDSNNYSSEEYSSEDNESSSYSNEHYITEDSDND